MSCLEILGDLVMVRNGLLLFGLWSVLRYEPPSGLGKGCLRMFNCMRMLCLERFRII